MAPESNSPLQLSVGRIPWREVDGEIVALDPATSVYISINGSGAMLWRALVEGSSAEGLAELLSTRYGIDPAQAAEDVAKFLRQLAERDWLTPVAP